MKEINKSVDTRRSSFPYEDILKLPHPTSKKHERMSIENRAGQFMPFAALTGFGDAVDETARLTTNKKILSEDQQQELDFALNKCFQFQNEHPRIEVTYFEKDLLKEGGSYITITDNLQKLETFERVIILQNKLQIPIKDIFSIVFI